MFKRQEDWRASAQIHSPGWQICFGGVSHISASICKSSLILNDCYPLADAQTLVVLAGLLRLL